ncbi:MAG: YdcH family protein [Parvularculaceae bacterium]
MSDKDDDGVDQRLGATIADAPPAVPPANGEAVVAGETRTGVGANDEALLIRISDLEQRHGDLDLAIAALEAQASADRLAVARLKKRKLALKDLILTLKDSLTPDIIA